MFIKKCLNLHVDLKVLNDLQFFLSSGREFHSNDAVYKKPYDHTSLHLGITSKNLLEEHNVLEGIYCIKSLHKVSAVFFFF